MRKGELLRDVVAAIDQAGYKLCVIRNYQDYPESIDSDVDAISDNPEKIAGLLAEREVANIVQVFERETHLIYLQRWYENKPIFLTLEVSGNYSYKGRVFFKGKEFLEACRPFKFFRVPTAELEFASSLIHRVTKGSLGEAKARRLSELFRENPEGASHQLARFFSDAEVALIREAALTGEWEPVRAQIRILRQRLLSRARGEQLLRVLRYWINAVRWQTARVLRPSGLSVALLGTDGSGKSSVMQRIEEDLAPAFWRRKRYHKRPLSSPFRWTKRYGIRPPASKDVQPSGFIPHALPPRGPAYSLMKLGFWWVDFVLLGYVMDVLPRLMHHTLVLFDRYYQDLLVDPRRYHYGGPMWLARLVGRLVPKPHLVFLCDAPPEVLYTRKQELPLEEVVRQREAYLELVQGLPNGYVIDTSRPLDTVVAEVEQIILDFMARRNEKRQKF